MTDPRQLVAWQRERRARIGGPLWPNLTESDWCEFADELADALEAAVARANQLEKALREIADYMPSQTTSDPLPMTAVLSDVREIAIAALAGVPAEPATEEKP